MTISRRAFSIGIAAISLSGCVGTGGGRAPAVARPDPATDPDLRPQPNASYDAWVAAFRDRAMAQGISAATFDAGFRGQGYLPGVIERDRNQTEFKRSLEDYLAIVAPEEKLRFGKPLYARQIGTLRQIEDRYGVPPHILGAVWGLESYFGTKRGTIPVISATSTLAWEGRRGRFFESNLMDALRIIQTGDARPAQLVGSWAGAMGHTQLIPNAYQANAVDFNGDGKRDIWTEDPTDALASTARFLSRAGWRRGQTWGLEVTVPNGYSGPTGRGNTRSVATWRDLGLRPAKGGSLPDHGSAALLAPMGLGRPSFLVYHNFNMILRYNPSENYGLGIGYLADRLNGGGPLSAGFGPDQYGLTLDDRKALQRGLTQRGFDAGTPDGVLGKKTEAAIRAYQQEQGLPVTGTPSRDLLRRLT
ncbi:lytic murein transglycosylase [Tropicibacter oceani]|uniref:Lytic murein transglycosylase n=1 Tax=Tropicibacter oceani TaxID=3058420 RepID=A0ABY8QN30_9RHOB|nr:lytic murein transglycosylase [Tropicibacter oceani]WGW05421.1 lytic murein transglycosylase [Tropicibacter oceani]